MSNNTITPEDNSNTDKISSVSLVEEMKKSYTNHQKVNYNVEKILFRALILDGTNFVGVGPNFGPFLKLPKEGPMK